MSGHLKCSATATGQRGSHMSMLNPQAWWKKAHHVFNQQSLSAGQALKQEKKKHHHLESNVSMVTVLLKLVCEWILYFCPQKHSPTYCPPAHPLSHTIHIEISSYPCSLQTHVLTCVVSPWHYFCLCLTRHWFYVSLIFLGPCSLYITFIFQQIKII